MANLLADANLWADAQGSPPASWDGSSYVVSVGSGTSGAFWINYSGAAPSPGDTLAGSAVQTNTTTPEPDVYLCLVETNSFIVQQSVHLPAGVPVDFSWPALDSMRLVLSSSPDSPYESSLYGLNITVSPAIEPVEECSYNCSCDPQAGTRNIDTLGNLASRLIRRLGFVDPLGDAEVRTLGDFRTELMIRLGYAANAANPPAGMLSLLDAVVNESQQLLWRRLELDQEGAQPPRMVDVTDVNVLDYPLVFAHALGQLKAHYNKPDAKLYLDQAEKQLGDYMRRSPPSIQFLARDFLKEAQRFLYQKAASFRQSRFFYWPLEKGVRFYDFAQNEGECEHRFVPELIEGVYVTEGDDCTTERWRELAAGINPLLYNGGVRESWPYRYEFRQCIEIFPAPDGRAGYLRVKAKFELQPFEDDSDYTTIDADLVFLQALAVGQEHFQQKNAQLTHALVRSRLGDIIAGEHHTRRYIPDDPFEPPANPPRPRDGFIES